MNDIDRDSIAELLHNRFEELTYGLASQIGDFILQNFSVEPKPAPEPRTKRNRT